MTDECDHEAELESQERRLTDARALFAMANRHELFDALVRAVKAKDIDAIADMIAALPPLSAKEGDAADTLVNTAFLAGTKRLMRGHAAWIDLRSKVRTFYEEMEIEVMNTPESSDRTTALALLATAREEIGHDNEGKFSA